MELENELPGAVHAEATRPPTAGAANLGEIAAEIETFLGRWISRLEGVLAQYGDSATGDRTLATQIAEFEEEQRRWNEYRQQEMQQMQETADQLTAAWERLENEQRRLLEAQENLHQRNWERDLAAPAQPGAARTPATQSGATGAKSFGDPEPSGDAAPLTHDLAVRQFQQLRRQIGIHPPGNKAWGQE